MAVTDLTGTTWVFNNTVDYLPSPYDFSINYTLESTTGEVSDAQNRLYGQYAGSGIPGAPWWVILISEGQYAGVMFTNCIYEGHSGGGLAKTTVGGIVVKAITITGGTDVTNAALISWLEANATQQGGSQLTVDMSTLTGWDALSSGTHSVQIVAKATGYRDSVPSKAVQFTKAASGYTVTINKTGDTSFANNWSVYDGADSSGTLLGNLTNGSTADSFIITSGEISVIYPGASDQRINSYSGSGGVSNVSDLGWYGSHIHATVSADGTLNLNFYLH